MQNKQVKIHHLKGKAKPVNPTNPSLIHVHSAKGLNQLPNNSPQLRTNLSRPILIRYIDPRLVPIFKEFNQLKIKCEEIALSAKGTTVDEAENQQKINELLKSTKKINDQFNELIDEVKVSETEPFTLYEEQSRETNNNEAKQLMNQEVGQKSEVILQQSLINESASQYKKLLQKANDRIAELEATNIQTLKMFEEEKKHAFHLQRECKELKNTVIKLQKQKKQIIVNIKGQLQKLREDNKPSIFGKNIFNSTTGNDSFL